MIFKLPALDSSKYIYIYGSGLMGASYKRQIEQQGMSHLFLGYIESDPKTNSHLDFPMIKVESLCVQQIFSSQVLVASNKYKLEILDELLSMGWLHNDILLPMEYRWLRNIKFKSDFFYKKNKICIYNVINSKIQLDLIYKRVIRYLLMRPRGGVKPSIVLVVSFSVEFISNNYPEVSIIRQSSYLKFPEKVVSDSDVVFIFNSEDYREIDSKDRFKIYFYGLGLIKGFEKRCKYFLSKKMPIKHKHWINDLKGKQKIRIIFLSLYKGIWKLDTLFNQMMQDPFFEPIVLVCPYIEFGEERMWKELKNSYDYFIKKGYPTVSSFDDKRKKWRELKELRPDIVFISRAHSVTFHEYQENAYLNYLSCYVPYYFDIATGGNDNHYYNKILHNAVWRVFSSTAHSVSKSKEIAVNKGRNVELTGHPMLEPFLNSKQAIGSAWKNRSVRKKRIIFAPHQAIESFGALQMSTFLLVADEVKRIAEKYKDSVQWVFKPHPMLIDKLYNHPRWGKTRTDAYYKFWSDSSYSQINTDDYVRLFVESDAIIHDCGSFIFEYLLVSKPCAYLLLKPMVQLRSLNQFGKDSLNYYTVIKNIDGIEKFVNDIVNGVIFNPNNTEFLKENVERLYVLGSPSEKIVNIIKKNL